MQRPFKPGTKTSNTTTKFAGQKALPPGKKGGALAKVTKALPAGKVGGALVKGASKLGRTLGIAGSALAVADTTRSILDPRSEGNQQLGKAMSAVNKRFSSNYGPRFKNPNSGPVASKGAKPKAPMPKNAGAALREKSYASLQKFTVPKPVAKPKPVAPKAATTPARSTAPSRSSAPGRSSTPARTTSSRPAAKPATKSKASVTESSLSASDVMKGYGMRVNQTFSAESPSTPKKRQSLREQTAEIKQMIEESKKRQGKG
jgi:hypothetical protein